MISRIMGADLHQGSGVWTWSVHTFAWVRGEQSSPADVVGSERGV